MPLPHCIWQFGSPCRLARSTRSHVGSISGTAATLHLLIRSTWALVDKEMFRRVAGRLLRQGLRKSVIPSRYVSRLAQRSAMLAPAKHMEENFMDGTSATYIEQMYESWTKDKSSVHSVRLIFLVPNVQLTVVGNLLVFKRPLLTISRGMHILRTLREGRSQEKPSAPLCRSCKLQVNPSRDVRRIHFDVCYPMLFFLFFFVL